MPELTGGCQCGEIRYEVTTDPLATIICHCKECKRQSGSAFGMSMIVPRDGFRLTSGKPKTFSRGAESGGSVECAFCGAGGTRIFHRTSKLPKTLNVKPGTLDDMSRIRPAMQTWTGERLAWFSVEGELPEFEKNPG